MFLHVSVDPHVYTTSSSGLKHARADIARLFRKDPNQINEIGNTEISRNAKNKKRSCQQETGKVTDVEIFVRKRRFYNINFSTEKFGNYQEQKRYTKVLELLSTL